MIPLISVCSHSNDDFPWLFPLPRYLTCMFLLPISKYSLLLAGQSLTCLRFFSSLDSSHNLTPWASYSVSVSLSKFPFFLFLPIELFLSCCHFHPAFKFFTRAWSFSRVISPSLQLNAYSFPTRCIPGDSFHSLSLDSYHQLRCAQPPHPHLSSPTPFLIPLQHTQPQTKEGLVPITSSFRLHWVFLHRSCIYFRTQGKQIKLLPSFQVSRSGWLRKKTYSCRNVGLSPGVHHIWNIQGIPQENRRGLHSTNHFSCSGFERGQMSANSNLGFRRHILGNVVDPVLTLSSFFKRKEERSTAFTAIITTHYT